MFVVKTKSQKYVLDNVASVNLLRVDRTRGVTKMRLEKQTGPGLMRAL